jgi:hypothetical protein
LTGKLYPFLQKLIEKAHNEQTDEPLEGTLVDPRHLAELPNIELQTENETTYKPGDLSYMEKQNSDFAYQEEHQLKLINPWSNGEDGTAPEDEQTDLPVNFGEALTFLGKSHKEAVQDYLALHETHISPEMKAETDILDYLKTEEVIKVFVPTEWTGIKGIPPPQVEGKDDLPPMMKPKARPLTLGSGKHLRKN